MNITVNGLALVCALCPALADVGVPGGLVIAVASLQDAEKTNDAPDVDPWAVAGLQKMITELERYDRVILATKETNNGQEGYVSVSPPPNYEVDALPSDAKEVTVEDETYFYSAAERCFYTKIARDGKTRYVIVDAPLGALVDALPRDAVEYEEEGEKVYQYGDAYFVKETEDKGKSGYAVTAPPASEVIEADKPPEDAGTMDVDDKTYYYINGAFYVPDAESRKKVYAVAEPPEGGNVMTVPDGAVVFTVEATKYYQFDNVFFKDKPGGGYVIVAESSSS